jgi:hypothetical protein
MMAYSMGPMGFFNVSKLHDNESLIWTTFNNPKASFTTRIRKQHLYTTNIPKHQTPIQPISKEIQVGAKSNHVITDIHYPIQLDTTHTIHHSQGLILDYLAFDLNGVHHHGLAYTILSCVRKKEELLLFTPLIDANFKVDKCVSNEMQNLITIAQWHLCN